MSLRYTVATQAPCPAAAPGSATAPGNAQTPAPCSPSSFICGALQDIIVSGSLYSGTEAAIQSGKEQCVLVGNGTDCLVGNILVDTVTFAAISAGTCTPNCQGDAFGTLLILQLLPGCKCRSSMWALTAPECLTAEACTSSQDSVVRLDLSFCRYQPPAAVPRHHIPSVGPDSGCQALRAGSGGACICSDSRGLRECRGGVPGAGHLPPHARFVHSHCCLLTDLQHGA